MRAALILLFLSSMIHFNLIAADDSIKVDVIGVLKNGVVAIGGETTGTTITAKGVTWELEASKFQKRAKHLDGKHVRVQGELERRGGVEIRERWIVQVTGLDSAAAGKPQLDAKEIKAGGEIKLSEFGGNPLITVRCRRGIGGATILRLEERWPDKIAAHLHLNGLESFKVQSGKRELEWSVSSDQNKRTRLTLRENGKEVKIKPGDPLYSEVGTMADTYRITLPAKLFEGNPQEITLRWIDFYR